jgi:hypothetical protein
MFAHWPQNGHIHTVIEQKPSIEGKVIESSNQILLLIYRCERAATISLAPSAKFSDAKAMNVVTQSGYAVGESLYFSRNMTLDLRDNSGDLSFCFFRPECEPFGLFRSTHSIFPVIRIEQLGVDSSTNQALNLSV